MKRKYDSAIIYLITRHDTMTYYSIHTKNDLRDGIEVIQTLMYKVSLHPCKKFKTIQNSYDIIWDYILTRIKLKSNIHFIQIILTVI